MSLKFFVPTEKKRVKLRLCQALNTRQNVDTTYLLAQLDTSVWRCQVATQKCLCWDCMMPVEVLESQKFVWIIWWEGKKKEKSSLYAGTPAVTLIYLIMTITHCKWRKMQAKHWKGKIIKWKVEVLKSLIRTKLQNFHLR